MKSIYYKNCKKIALFIYTFCLLSIFSTVDLFGMIQWADTILESSGNYYTKQKHKNCYSNKQILGPPNVMPDFGESVCAWMPRTIGRSDFITVGYKEPMYVQQVAIFENYRPGAIVKVTLFGEDKDTVIYSNSSPNPMRSRGRVLNIIIPKTSFKVERLRIDINTERYRDFYQIDAVAISDETKRIDCKINLSSDVLEIGDPENLGNTINSRYSELAPVIAPDGKTLYFTRENHPYNYGSQSIWFAEMDTNGQFKQAQNIGKPLNTRYHSFAISILPDGNSMLVGNVYHPNGTQSEGFSMTYKQDDSTWSFPEKVVVEDYYNNARGSYCLASNGRILLLSVDRADGYGSNDLYVSFLQTNGRWSKPRNLGTDINTADQENSPFLAADGVTLYFASAGHPGYGSCDVFVTKRLDDTWQKWSEPINLGPKINTRGWDAYFTVTASGDYAYFVSSKNLRNNEDIYRAKLPAELQPESVVLVYGKVINKKTNKPIEAEIVYEKLSTGEIIGSARSNPKTGEYKIALPAKEKYSFRAEAKGFIPVNENLDLMELKNYYEVQRDLYLVPIEEGQTVRINNIFFNTGESELLPDSYPELKRLVKILKENPSMTIKLLGHTDNVGTSKDNLILSNERAEAVKNYIIGLGIDGNRITTKGFGFSKPVSTNKTEEGRALNRRVECQILTK